MPLDRFQPLDGVTVDRRRQFLVVVDDTPECRRALRFAAGRAAHTLGGNVLLLHVMRPPEFIQWGAVQDMMAQEILDNAHALMNELASQTESYCGQRPDIRIERGKTVDVVMKLLAAEPDIFGLVLGASATGAPGPLIGFFTGDIAGSLPCPVIIVPGSLSDDALDGIV